MIYSAIFTRAASLVVGHSTYFSSVGEVNLKHKSTSLILCYQTEFALTQLDYVRWMRVTVDQLIAYQRQIFSHQVTEIPNDRNRFIIAASDIFHYSGWFSPRHGWRCLCDRWRQDICSLRKDWTGPKWNSMVFNHLWQFFPKFLADVLLNQGTRASADMAEPGLF